MCACSVRFASRSYPPNSSPSTTDIHHTPAPRHIPQILHIFAIPMHRISPIMLACAQRNRPIGCPYPRSCSSYPPLNGREYGACRSGEGLGDAMTFDSKLLERDLAWRELSRSRCPRVGVARDLLCRWCGYPWLDMAVIGRSGTMWCDAESRRLRRRTRRTIPSVPRPRRATDTEVTG
jgi:hypothetical protein